MAEQTDTTAALVETGGREALRLAAAKLDQAEEHYRRHAAGHEQLGDDEQCQAHAEVTAEAYAEAAATVRTCMHALRVEADAPAAEPTAEPVAVLEEFRPPRLTRLGRIVVHLTGGAVVIAVLAVIATLLVAVLVGTGTAIGWMWGTL